MTQLVNYGRNFYIPYAAAFPPCCEASPKKRLLFRYRFTVS